jgi:hypothetical protein
VFDLRTRRSELLTRETAYERRDYRDRPLGLAWAPDGRSVAYVAGSLDFERGIESGNLRIVTLSGQVRTIVDADRAYGGRIVSLAWTQPPRTLRYQTPEPAPPTRVTPESALAPGPISRLAADGSRVAFVACQGVFVWTPAIGELTALLESDPLSRCLRRDYFSVGYSFAIAGDRVAYGEYSGNCVLTATLRLEVLEPSRMSAELARRPSSCGRPSAGVGWAAGAGDLLVFSTWKETCPFPPGCERYATTSQQINRVGPGGCPCPAVASTPGPLIPADVDGGRIVAFGENATVLLDREGNTLLTLPVSPLAAQLSGTDLVLVLRGQLRHYDARSGALLHAWPLPDSVGARCELRCVPGGLFPRLLIEDLARGLIAYVDEGRVHLLRLSDGADAIVASGADARFIDKGLVYADGSRLHLVPFPALPLRSFARSTTNGNDSDQSEVLSGR